MVACDRGGSILGNGNRESPSTSGRRSIGPDACSRWLWTTSRGDYGRWVLGRLELAALTQRQFARALLANFLDLRRWGDCIPDPWSLPRILEKQGLVGRRT